MKKIRRSQLIRRSWGFWSPKKIRRASSLVGGGVPYPGQKNTNKYVKRVVFYWLLIFGPLTGGFFFKFSDSESS